MSWFILFASQSVVSEGVPQADHVAFLASGDSDQGGQRGLRPQRAATVPGLATLMLRVAELRATNSFCSIQTLKVWRTLTFLG